MIGAAATPAQAVVGDASLVSHVPASPTTTANRSSSDPVISADGAFVAFESSASDLVSGQTENNSTADVFLLERATGVVTLVSHTPPAPRPLRTRTALTRSSAPVGRSSPSCQQPPIW